MQLQFMYCKHNSNIVKVGKQSILLNKRTSEKHSILE